MTQRIVPVVAVWVLLALPASGVLRAQQVAPPSQQPSGPSLEQVSQWVGELDAERFEMRTLATDQLLAAGFPAVAPLRAALAGGTLERTTRTIYILGELAMSNDLRTAEAACEALSAIAATRATAAARRAADALARLDDVRQERAARELTELGATVISGARVAAFHPGEALQIRIDEKWKGQPGDLRRLKWLRDAQVVILIGPQITDETLTYLVGLQTLGRLEIRHAAVSDGGLAVLQKLDGLVDLSMLYMPVSDAALPILESLSGLSQLRLYGTDVTREGAARLVQALPRATVDHRHGAFLGVSCQMPPWPCEVTTVRPNSGAKQAGILEGDVIVAFDDKPIATFDDLRECIREFKVGNSALVRVARGGEPISRQVTREGDAALGLEPKTHPLGVEVSGLKPEGIAAKAGVQIGDIIMSLDERRVTTGEELEAAFQAAGAGQAVRLELVRGSTSLVYKVTFGEFDDLQAVR